MTALCWRNSVTSFLRKHATIALVGTLNDLFKQIIFRRRRRKWRGRANMRNCTAPGFCDRHFGQVVMTSQVTTSITLGWNQRFPVWVACAWTHVYCQRSLVSEEGTRNKDGILRWTVEEDSGLSILQPLWGGGWSSAKHIYVGGKRASLIRRLPDLARSSFWWEKFVNENVWRRSLEWRRQYIEIVTAVHWNCDGSTLK